jgi:hypothetical protein
MKTTALCICWHQVSGKPYKTWNGSLSTHKLEWTCDECGTTAYAHNADQAEDEMRADK